MFSLRGGHYDYLPQMPKNLTMLLLITQTVLCVIRRESEETLLKIQLRLEKQLSIEYQL
jgi:hypothetical protein